MNLLPKASGSRPRLAVELFANGVVAGRSPEPGLPLATVSKVDLAEHAIVPGLRPGNIADRVAVITALRRVLEPVGGRANGRNADLTLVIPDAAVRVLLLDFDTLPGKLSEALPLVRFRLKKLVPFDTDQAMVSFQVLSTSRSMIRVLAVAIPRDVLSEYESVVREVGFEPGSVLPSTLAALAGLQEGEGASLVVNAHPEGVTTAIVRAGIVLLHRSIELAEFAAPTPGNFPPALFDTEPQAGLRGLLTIEDRDSTGAEWAAQEPLPEYGRNPYMDRVAAEEVTQDQDAVTALPVRSYAVGAQRPVSGTSLSASGGAGGDRYNAGETAPVSRSPYASPDLQQQLDAQFHNAAYVAPSVEEMLTPNIAYDESSYGGRPGMSRTEEEAEPPTHLLAADVQAEEIARAVSVAIAYFEDSLAAVPEVLLSAGPLGADALQRTLQEQGLGGEGSLRVRELVGAENLAQATAAVPRGWLAGVTGALRS